MPQAGQKHTTQEEFQIPWPSEGMNLSAPVHLLPPSQARIIENLYYDYSSGVLRTRWPFRRYSTTSPNDSGVNGIYYWNDTMFFACNNKLFYLDANKAYVQLGDIGTEPPSFLPFHNKLQIASGIGLQQVDTSTVFSTVSGTGMPTSVKQLYEQNTRLWAIGNSSYPNYIHGSAVNDETTWSGAGTIYYELGQSNDEAPLIGLVKGPSGYIVLFKKGDQQKYTGFLDPNETAPVWRVVSNNESAHIWRGTAYTANKLWVMDTFCPMAMTGTDATERLVIDPDSLVIGTRIASIWDVDTTGFCVVYPPHAQIWFSPSASSEYIYILHYLTGALTRFRLFGGLRFYSAFYLPSTKTLFLGGNDGYIYTYDTTGTGAYQDNPDGTNCDYLQRFYSAVFEIWPRYEHILKKPTRLEYRGLEEGTGKWSFYKNFGATIIADDFDNVSITYTSSYPTLYEYRDTTLYSKRDEFLYVSQMRSTEIPYDSPGVDNIQMQLEVSSGAIEIRKIDSELARGRKK